MSSATDHSAPLVRITTSSQAEVITKLLVHIHLPKSYLQSLAANASFNQKPKKRRKKTNLLVTLKVPAAYLRSILSKYPEKESNEIIPSEQVADEIELENTVSQEVVDEIDKELKQYFDNQITPVNSESVIDPIFEDYNENNLTTNNNITSNLADTNNTTATAITTLPTTSANTATTNNDICTNNDRKRRKSFKSESDSQDISRAKISNPSSRKNSIASSQFIPTQVDTQTRVNQDLDYRPIPKNIIPLLQNELLDLNDDEDLGIIDKMIFSLIDPLSASRIKLPVKPTKCIHFECFDYETFCLFNKIPTSIVKFIKSEMINKNLTRLKNINNTKPKPKKVPVKQQKDYIEIIDEPKFYNNPNIKSKFIAPILPNYKCPLCDQKFFLSDLEIYDSFNYFLKFTPKNTNRVELVDMNKYRVIDDSSLPATNNDEDLIVLSDHESDIEIQKQKSPNPQATFDDDSLDKAMLGISNHLFNHTASGSWDDPIEL